MTKLPRELIWDYALGNLPPEEYATVAAEVARSPELRAELVEVERVCGSLALSLDPVAPSAATRDRLLGAIAAGTERFAPFVERLCDMYDLEAGRIRELLGAIDDPAANWRDELCEGFSALHFRGGPREATADCGLVRLKPGMLFPLHRHLGEESALVLQGSFRDLPSNRVYRAGDYGAMPANSTHAYTNHTDEDCIVAVRLHEGMELV